MLTVLLRLCVWDKGMEHRRFLHVIFFLRFDFHHGGMCF
jgi:hypothetical protein